MAGRKKPDRVAPAKAGSIPNEGVTHRFPPPAAPATDTDGRRRLSTTRGTFSGLLEPTDEITEDNDSSHHIGRLRHRSLWLIPVSLLLAGLVVGGVWWQQFPPALPTEVADRDNNNQVVPFGGEASSRPISSGQKAEETADTTTSGNRNAKRPAKRAASTNKR